MLSSQNESLLKLFLHVEVCLKPECLVPRQTITDRLARLLHGQHLLTNTDYKEYEIYPELSNAIQSIYIAECEGSNSLFIDTSHAHVELRFHLFRLFDEDPMEELSLEDENVVHYSVWNLPSKSLYGLWESLVFDDGILLKLLNFLQMTLVFSELNIDPNLVALNRLIFLYGPPGTGKTSICKALAQKIAIRFSNKFKEGRFIEINSHSLFSKYYSESGKLVQSLFKEISELAEDSNIFLTLLIDEVESLTTARKVALNGSEPSDSIRVVNAVLTQIDKLRSRSNVLIMATSNITEIIDSAFLDRADLIQFIGRPSQNAVYAILVSCFRELMRVRLIEPTVSLLDLKALLALPFDPLDPSYHIWDLARKFQGSSGRFLRKLPFLVYSEYIQKVPVSIEYLLAKFESYVNIMPKRDQFDNQ